MGVVRRNIGTVARVFTTLIQVINVNLLQIATRDDKRTLPHQMVQFCDDNKRVDYANAAGRKVPQNSVPTGRDPSPCLQR